MRCPYCGNKDNTVIDSRQKENNTIHRRRECEHCGGRYNAVEQIVRGPVPKVKKAIVIGTGKDEKSEYVLLIRNKRKEEEK